MVSQPSFYSGEEIEDIDVEDEPEAGHVTAVAAIKDYIRTKSRFNVRDLATFRPDHVNEMQWRSQYIWRAIEDLQRGERIVFDQSGNRDGDYHLCTTVDSIMKKSGKFRGYAKRKLARALSIVGAAVGIAADPEEQRRLARLESTLSSEVLHNTRAIRQASKKRPPGI